MATKGKKTAKQGPRSSPPKRVSAEEEALADKEARLQQRNRLRRTYGLKKL